MLNGMLELTDLFVAERVGLVSAASLEMLRMRTTNTGPSDRSTPTANGLCLDQHKAAKAR